MALTEGTLALPTDTNGLQTIGFLRADGNLYFPRAADGGGLKVARDEYTRNATVAAAATVSDAVDCRGYAPVGIVVPSTFDGTEISFQVSVDGSAYQALYDLNNVLLALTVSASRSYPLWAELAIGWAYMKVVCTTAQATTSTVFPIMLEA